MKLAGCVEINSTQFSWRVKKVVPNATHIVDTQDLHFLRVLRQVANAEGKYTNCLLWESRLFNLLEQACQSSKLPN